VSLYVFQVSQISFREVVVHSHTPFNRYLFDEKATADAHDAEGYFKTGDIARREGKYYFILGRASIDIIKSGGYKISALDIEREILGLDYVSEVMVVGVEDEEFGQRVAATVSLKQDQKTTRKSLTIAELREDLRSKMAGYKMPTVLRVVQGELPKSGTGKVQKKILGPQFFPPNYRQLPEVQVWSRENKARL
jgi:malonyl-CoA/methylmalonyl-CoA synthetase